LLLFLGGSSFLGGETILSGPATAVFIVFLSSRALLKMTVNPSAEPGLVASHSPNFGNGLALFPYTPPNKRKKTTELFIIKKMQISSQSLRLFFQDKRFGKLYERRELLKSYQQQMQDESKFVDIRDG